MRKFDLNSGALCREAKSCDVGFLFFFFKSIFQKAEGSVSSLSIDDMLL